MVSLLDIGPSEIATKTVSIRGKDIPVYGISIQDLILLVTRFPEMKVLLSGGVDTINAQTLVTLIPNAMGALLASGTGKAGDEEVERIAAGLGLEEQIDLIGAIIELTLPSGFGPFVERLTGFLEGRKRDGANITKVPDTSSPSRSLT